MKKLKWAGALMFLFAIVATTGANGQSRMSRAVLGAGGGSSGNGAARISVTVGQTAIGDIGTSGIIVQKGFWYRSPASVTAGFTPPETPVTGRHTLSAGIWPNPSSGNATLVVDIPAVGELSVVLYDAWGNSVRTLHNGPCTAQRLNIPLDGTGLPSGIYTAVLTSAGERAMVAYHIAR